MICYIFTILFKMSVQYPKSQYIFWMFRWCYKFLGKNAFYNVRLGFDKVKYLNHTLLFLLDLDFKH